jgi:hypothetical protein
VNDISFHVDEQRRASSELWGEQSVALERPLGIVRDQADTATPLRLLVDAIGHLSTLPMLPAAHH